MLLYFSERSQFRSRSVFTYLSIFYLLRTMIRYFLEFIIFWKLLSFGCNKLWPTSTSFFCSKLIKQNIFFAFLRLSKNPLKHCTQSNDTMDTRFARTIVDFIQKCMYNVFLWVLVSRYLKLKSVIWKPSFAGKFQFRILFKDFIFTNDC